MEPVKLLRRHPFVMLISLLIAGTGLWIGYYLATFDLNHYREYLAEELGRHLQLPVQIGEAHLELREAGIAFRFTDLQIGTAQTPTEIRAERLWLQLAWHGLLLRKPVFSEVALDTPLLRIAPEPESSSSTPPSDSRFPLDALRDLHVRRVEIRNGTVDVQWSDASGASRTLLLEELTVNLSDFGLASTVTFDLAAALPGQSQPARLAVTGRIDMPTAGTLREATWDLTLEATRLDAARLAGLLPDSAGIAAEGGVDLALFVSGRLDGVLTIRADASGTRLRIRPGAAYQQALPVKHLQVGGTWQRDGSLQHLRQLTVQLEDLRLTGEITVNTTAAGHEIDARLGNATLPVDSLRRWLPTDLQANQPVFARLQPGGTLILAQAAVRATLPAVATARGTLEIASATGEAHNLAWALGEAHRAELTTLHFRLEAGRWHLDLEQGMVAGLPVAFTGTLLPQREAPAQVAFDLRSNTTSEQLLSLWTGSLPAGLAVTGPVAWTGRLEGTTDRFTVAARADLAQMDLRYGEQLHLAPTPEAALELHGEGTPGALTITRASLAFAPVQGEASGVIAWGDSPNVNLTARLDLPDLTAVQALAPAAGKLQLHGAATLHAETSGPPAALRSHLALDLDKVTIPTHGIVADVTQLSGRLLLEGKGVRSERLTARLGSSPVSLNAQVADLTAPRLELEVQAPAVRADEVIFHSDRIMLRDVSGKLVFEPDGLSFSPVKVRLDKGTRATITGSVRDFAAPRVELNVSGEYANIEEIIGLWTDVSPAAEAARRARHAAAQPSHGPLPITRITVDAREGDLYSMKFANARAVIVPTTGHLLLHPLDFNVGDGYCSTQVLVDYTGRHPVLRVSGHAEDVDAYQVYNELLDRKSIMRGRLRGDFFLEGELGQGRFLPTAYGSLCGTVRDGVMRHSAMLGNIFSLLNVSQLFELKLPDINLEGLPFSLLTAELVFDRGVVNTRQMVVDSAAISMSYAGQYDAVKNRLDLLVVAKPLGTIDKVVTRLPIAGWILGGEEKALITAQFKVTGPVENPVVEAIPITAISKGVLGLFQRTLGLPLKLIEDPAILWGGGGEKKN